MRSRQQSRLAGWIRLAGLFLLFVGLFGGAAVARDESRALKPLQRVTLPDGSGDSVDLYRDSHALLIGVSDYTAGWPDLASIPRELDRVQTMLERQGFEVTRYPKEPGRPVSGSDLKQAFETFVSRHGYERKNRLLIYFSGHGYTWVEEEQGYLVPSDAPVPHSAGFPGPDFLQKALHMSQIMAWTRQMTANHVLFLFDSCFSGTVLQSKAIPQPRHISKLTAKPVRQFITAGGAGEEVPASSVFTPAFVDALEFGLADTSPKDGYITGTELGMYLRTTVSESSDQTPQFGRGPDYRHKLGDFVFRVPGAVPVDAAGPGSDDAIPPVAVPPAAPVGHVQVNVNAPATKVFIDRRYAGEASPGSPLNQRNLLPGSVTLRLEAEGFDPVTRNVRIVTGRWTQESVRLEPVERRAWLVVRSNVSRDTVYINQRAVGPTGPDRHALTPGEYRVRVEKGGYVSWEERVILAAGETRTLRAQLQPETGRSGPAPDMVFIAGGRYGMGSPASETGRDDDERLHPVTVGDFRIGRTEVTVGEFRRFVEATGYRTDAERGAGGEEGCKAVDVYSEQFWSRRGWANWRKTSRTLKTREDHPVACVSWNDAMAYIGWLNRETGGGYRLPTEAEWEYAARAGTTTARFWGQDPDQACRYANPADQTRMPNGNVWTSRHACDDGYVFVAPVAQFRPNGFGLHDMLGNLWEWTCSNYDGDYAGGESRCVANPKSEGRRVARGGSWANFPRWVRSAYRLRNPPGNRNAITGFRLAQDL